MIRWSLGGSTRHDSVGVGPQQRKRLVEQVGNAPQAQHDAWQQSLQTARSIGSVTDTIGTFELGCFARSHAHQRSQIVSQHLGMHIKQHRMLCKTRNAFKFHLMLEPLECLLDTPALVVELNKHLSGKIAGPQVRCQHPYLPIGRSAAHQSDLWSHSRTQNSQPHSAPWAYSP